MSGGRASPEVRRRASRDYYIKNAAAIRAKRNEQARLCPRKKDLTTPKERARARLRYAVWTGKITKPTHCEACGKEGKLHGHHQDYSEPLAVQWLCPPCHGLAHAQ